MSVKIIVDSASDITVAFAEKYGIGFALLKTTLAGKEYRDGVDIVSDEFYEKLVVNKELAYTSQVNVEEFSELFECCVCCRRVSWQGVCGGQPICYRRRTGFASTGNQAS